LSARRPISRAIESIARALYTTLLRLSVPLAILRLWWRGRREPGYRKNVAERFGRYDLPAVRGSIWVHAVSVGEARAAAPLVRALGREYPGRPLVVTCMTSAGRETLSQLYGETARTAYLPYDLPGSARRFLEHFEPALGVLMETELWPNLLAACRRREIPVLLANARMSERSARGYTRWRRLTRPAFECLSAVCAQSDADAERLAALGAADITVAGSLKFDVEPEPALLAAGQEFRKALGERAVLLLASTREGEEALLLEHLPREFAALLMVVPRHPARFDEVARLLAARGMRIARRSLGETPGASHHAYLGDTLGEMAFYYAACDVAMIGGSFMPLGGQNLIEGCAAGAPVVLGPSVFNFAEAAQRAVESGAAIQVEDAAQGLRISCALLEDSARRADMSAAGKRLVLAHRGAAARHLAVARRLLERAPGVGPRGRS
jgi:3-deoxy-D-manno-octulosonic-acid transferase